MSKFYALKGKDVFDISKVTVVGNPTITDDGIASGFSNGNYICSYEIKNTTTSLEINISANITDLSQTQQIIGSASDKKGIAIQLYAGGNKLISVLNGTNNAWQTLLGDMSITKTGLYDFNIKLDKGYWVVNVYRYGVLIATNSNNPVAFTSLDTHTLMLGNNGSWSFEKPFLGSINLTAFKIYVDNQLIYSPTKPTYLLERRKEGFDLSKFTVVGSPTITEYGVASGFSGNDYITVPLIDYSKPFEIKFRVKFNDNATTAQGTILALTNFNDYNNLLKHYYSNNKITIQFIKNGVNVGSKYLLDANIDYDVIFSWNGSKYLIKAKESYASEYNLNILESDNNEPISISSLVTSQSNVIIGARIYGQQLLGSIDLPSISITVDGKEVFTGAKENYYMLRR